MGDWSDAMEDGVICSGCAAPMGPGSGQAGYCDSCQQEKDQRSMNRDLRLAPEASRKKPV